MTADSPVPEYVTDEASLLHEIRDLLAEILERLPEPPDTRPALAGYRLGQDRPPTAGEFRVAQHWLARDPRLPQCRALPERVLSRGDVIATEIVTRYQDGHQ